MKTFNEFWQWQVCVPTDMEDEARCIWNAATEVMQAKLDEQTKELEVLRGFAKRILAQAKLVDANKVLDFAKELNLVDESGHPTKLLTGISDDI